jgi:hypothetical protein
MKKTCFHALSITIGLLCSTEGFSQASSATVELNAGLRAGRFHAAPSAESLWLQETAVAGYSPTLTTLGSVSVALGGSLGLSQMRGDLGPGLTSLSGYRINPAVKGEQSLAMILPRLRVFSALGYGYSRFSGRGSESWDANKSTSLFLLGAESIEERGKSYIAYGPNVSAGLTYGITQSLTVSTTVAVSLETMTGRSPIFSGGKEIVSKETTSFTSRSVLLGGGYVL